MTGDSTRCGLQYVQFGCGLSSPDGWLNFDASPTLRLQRMPAMGWLFRRSPLPPFPSTVRVGNIIAGLPVKDQSCAGVYSSHVLEHLALTDFRTALRHSYRMLAPHGIFRSVVPDLELCVRQYVSSTESDAGIRLMRDTLLGREMRPTGLGGAVRDFLGNSRHLWMWDFKGIAAELEDAGFTSIRRASIGDAADPAFLRVEEASRWQDAVGVEARRPG